LNRLAGKALITGSSGFIGLHLATELKKFGWEIHGVSRTKNSSSEDILSSCHTIDIREYQLLYSVLEKVSPDVVFHLAGEFTGDFESMYETNVIGTQNLLEAILRKKKDVRILINGSAAEYGATLSEGKPILENEAIHPKSLYGLTKAAQGTLARFYAKKHDLKVICVRTFNLVGPGEQERLVCSSIAHQVVRVENGRANKIVVQSLLSARDFMDVRDAVRAYIQLIQKGELGKIYNVCSGKLVKIQTVLETLLGMAKVQPILAQDPNCENDMSQICGDAGALFKATGWNPAIPIEQSLNDLLEWVRKEYSTT